MVPNNIKIKINSFKSLTKWKFTKKSLGKIVTVRVLEVVFCATIEWE